jgi:hypothetical protein
MSGEYKISDHWSVSTSIKVGMLADSGKIAKTIKTTTGSDVVTTYDTERIEQSGIMILPAISASYRF